METSFHKNATNQIYPNCFLHENSKLVVLSWTLPLLFLENHEHAQKCSFCCLYYLYISVVWYCWIFSCFHQTLKCSPNNYLTHTWWNPVFNFFERNVQTQVPCSFCWPITWPPACLKNPCKKYSMVQSGREEWRDSSPCLRQHVEMFCVWLAAISLFTPYQRLKTVWLLLLIHLI